MSPPRREPGHQTPVRLLALARRPIVIVFELAAITVAAMVTAGLPQAPDEERVQAFVEHWGALGRLGRAIGLNDVTHSAGFLAILTLALTSLLAVQWEQWRRLRRTWGEPLGPASFGRTPWRAEAPVEACRRLPAGPLLRSSGQLGQLGSPLFHLGLVVVVAAGLGRALLSADASVRLVEGETLAPAASAYPVQRGGALARPFSLPEPLRLEEVVVDRYPSGVVKQITARVRREPPGAAPLELAVNAPLDLGDEQLYGTQYWGVAALLVLHGAAGDTPRLVYLEGEDRFAEGALPLEDGREARFKVDLTVHPAARATIRIARGRVLLGLADLAVGQGVELGDGRVLTLGGLPRWVELRGGRDPSRLLFFAGLVLALIGVTLMMVLVRVDSAVYVEGGRLVVALRAARFAPLYGERFDALRKEWIG